MENTYRHPLAAPRQVLTRDSPRTAARSDAEIITASLGDTTLIEYPARDGLMIPAFLTLPPASRVNTVHMMRQMRPEPAPDMKALADKLHDHGAKSDLMESRAAFAEKRKPNFKGWNDPEDRYRLPKRG